MLGTLSRAQQLGRIGHSFSEANLQVLKEECLKPTHRHGVKPASACQDPQARRYMSQKYAELMQRPQAVASQLEPEARHKATKRSEERSRKTRLGQLASTGMKLPKAEPGTRTAMSTCSSRTLCCMSTRLRQTMDGKNVIMLTQPEGKA